MLVATQVAENVALQQAQFQRSSAAGAAVEPIPATVPESSNNVRSAIAKITRQYNERQTSLESITSQVFIIII
jgi:hypothetical protein